MMRAAAIATVAILLAGVPAQARVNVSEMAGVEAVPPPNGSLPLSLLLQGEKDIEPLREWLGATASVWVLADYTCKSLCGSTISIVAQALKDSGLKPGADFRFLVVGLDPKDSVADALTMKHDQIGSDGELVRNSHFLRTNAAAVRELTNAFGLHFRYDSEHDQFAHPLAAFVVTPDGRVVRGLSALALDAASLRLALVDAGRGQVGSVADHIGLICYGFDPVSGTYTLAVGRLLAGTALMTIIGLAALILVLLRREHVAPSR
ncbi:MULTISPECIES: SCO family protein [unclassified Bradyrhizobium]